MRARSDGFTLVEALVALLVLGLAVTAAVEASALTMRTQVAAERHLEAVALADAKLNELAALPTAALASLTQPSSGELVLPPHRYAWRAAVRRDTASPTLWHAAVSVEWAGGTFDLETVLYRRPRAGEAP